MEMTEKSVPEATRLKRQKCGQEEQRVQSDVRREELQRVHVSSLEVLRNLLGSNVNTKMLQGTVSILMINY